MSFRIRPNLLSFIFRQTRIGIFRTKCLFYRTNFVLKLDINTTNIKNLAKIILKKRGAYR